MFEYWLVKEGCNDSNLAIEFIVLHESSIFTCIWIFSNQTMFHLQNHDEYYMNIIAWNQLHKNFQVKSNCCFFWGVFHCFPWHFCWYYILSFAKLCIPLEVWSNNLKPPNSRCYLKPKHFTSNCKVISISQYRLLKILNMKYFANRHQRLFFIV